MKQDITGYAPSQQLTGGMGLGSVRPQQRYSANPFTYTSTAGASQPVPSFLDLLDQERVKTVEAIVKPVEAEKGPSLADTRTGIYNNDNRGQEGSNGPSGTNTNGGTLSADGTVSTGLGGHSVGFGSSTATANGGVSNGAAKGIGAAIGSALGIGPAAGASIGGRINDSINASGQASADAFNANMQDAISHSAPGTPGAMDDAGAANQAAAEAAAAADGYGLGSSADAQGSGGTGSGADSTGGSAGANGGTSDGDARGGGIAKGGSVKPKHLQGPARSGTSQPGKVGLSDIKAYTAGGPTPRGVDDGLVDAGVGDFILTAERTQFFGDDLLKALAEGKAEIVMLKGQS